MLILEFLISRKFAKKTILIFSLSNLKNSSNFLLKIILTFSIIYSFISLFSYLNIILTKHDFYSLYPFESILLLIGTLFILTGNFLIFILSKTGFWLSLIGVLIIIFVNISFDGISFFQSLYGVEFQFVVFFLLIYKRNGISTWNIIHKS